MPFVGLSHVGIVAPYLGQLVLFESTSLYPRPCLVRGVQTRGVQAHMLYERVRCYRGAVWHYPIIPPLEVDEARALTLSCTLNLGTDYDAIGAFRSRGIGFGWLEKLLRKEGPAGHLLLGIRGLGAAID